MHTYVYIYIYMCGLMSVCVAAFVVCYDVMCVCCMCNSYHRRCFCVVALVVSAMLCTVIWLYHYCLIVISNINIHINIMTSSITSI